MERSIQKTGLINLVMLLLAGAGAIILAWYSNTFAGRAGSVFFGIGFLIALISYFQMRLEEKERMEQLEFEEISRDKAAASLFTTDAETFPARRSREQFERFFTPTFTFLLCIVEGVVAWYLWKWLTTTLVGPPTQPAVALALFGVIALVLFLAGKYSANLARLQKERLLRPASSYIVLGAYVSFAIALGIGLVLMGVPRADVYVGRGLVILLGLIAIESLLSVILEIYRPRVRGKQDRVVYESRLVGLLAQPEGLFTTAAQALDYQFGFKVSETWVYRFLERALAWLILLQFGVLVLSSCFVFISPGEQGLIETFGRPRSAVLEPGLHAKLPWPLAKVYRFRTDEIQSLHIGMQPDKDHGTAILWTVAHEKEAFNVMVASKNAARTNNINAGTNNPAVGGVPIDLVTIGIPIQYQISDVRAWAYNHVDAPRLLERIATREIIQYFASVDLLRVMSEGRGPASQELLARISKIANELKLGVKVIFVGLEDIHPPVKVAPAFENVIGTQLERQSRVLQAQGEASKTVILAEAQAQQDVRQAESYRLNRTASSAAEAEQFQHRVAAYRAAPEVYQERLYLETFGKNATNTRLYVVTSTNTQDVVNLNLEDKIAPGIADGVAIPSSKSR